MPVSLEQARRAKERAREVVGTLAHVVGVGIIRIGNDYAVKINLAAPPCTGFQIPATVDGVPIQVEIVGTITKR
jgi:hypothetical protein